jgi:hypothetical protein
VNGGLYGQAILQDHRRGTELLALLPLMWISGTPTYIHIPIYSPYSLFLGKCTEYVSLKRWQTPHFYTAPTPNNTMNVNTESDKSMKPVVMLSLYFIISHLQQKLTAKLLFLLVYLTILSLTEIM